MNTQSKPLSKRALPAFAAFAATLLSLPVSSVMAQSFPQYPLQTGAGNTEPNILFILDDSGSMTGDEMPNPDLDTVCLRDGTNCNGFDISGDTYVSNTLKYDPRVNYQAWLQANGTRMTGGNTLASVYTSDNMAGTGATTGSLVGDEETFYVPKDMTQTSATYLGNTLNYYRYQVLQVGVNNRFVRSELLAPNANVVLSNNDVDSNSGMTAIGSFTVPAGTLVLSVTLSGGTHGDNNNATNNDGNGADLYVRRTTAPTTGAYDCRSNGGDNNETCTISNPAAGTWHVGVNAASRYRNVVVRAAIGDPLTGIANANCGTDLGTLGWRQCTVATPTAARTDQDLEATNFALWYSFHRTRMKIAKAGAAEAFFELNDSVRVGFRTIHNRNTYDIPVTNGSNGVFSGTARTTWFNRLFGAAGDDVTPLRSALKSAGDYFSNSANTGPYGPETGTAQFACRQNFSILTTDGYWNSDSGFTIGDQDGTSGVAIIDPTEETTDPNYNIIRYTRSYPYRDTRSNTNYSNTLADVAMYYWKRDLRTDLDNIVPVADAQAAFWQHMVTFGISIGLKGTVDQTSVAQVMQDNGPRINGNPVAWPNPDTTDTGNNAGGAKRIDDLLHAAVNGHGEFIAATNAQRFRDALVGVLGQIQSRLASGSNVATNSATFLAGAKMFQATYRTGQWTGDVISKDVTEAGISSTELWRATERITAAGANYKNRTVLTWSGTAGAAFPTGAQTTALARTTGVAPVTGANNAAYIRGDQANEQSNDGVLRNRVTVLGDIVNSSPFYATDTETLYVGSNDGMLHALDADTGNTLFSYLPAGVNLTALAGLSDPAYGHSFFMDGPITVSGDRVVTDTNYLVGTLGRGGKGAFALDVSDPATMGNGDVLWDHTAATDADMGYIIGIPMIVKGNNNELLALVPNGIDSTNGGAHLYIYDVTDGTLIRKISTGVTGGNGLSAPRANDRNADQKVDYVYAGDMLGNIWKFDLTSSDPADWEVDLGGEPLFTATDADGNAQPITGGLALARDAAADKRFVTFGTGRLVRTSDLSSDDVQSMYGIIDDDVPIESRDDLEEHTIAAVWVADGVTKRAFENFQALPTTAKGWVVDLDNPTPGERVIGGAQVNGRAAIMSSVIPSEGDGCEPDGAGFLNAIDVFTGTSPEATGGGGATSSFFQTTTGNSQTVVVDGVTYSTGSIDMGVGLHGDGGLVNNGSSIVVCGSDATCEDEDLGDSGGGAPEPRRTSWRELFGED